MCFLLLPGAAQASSIGTTLSYLTAGSLLLALMTLGGVLVSGRAMRRELERRASDRDHELAERRHMETRLRVTQSDLEERLIEREAECEQLQEKLASTEAQLLQITARLERLARIDAQTGVANRQRFEEALEDEIKRMVRDQNPLSLMLCEIDFFEAFEESNGEERASNALTRVATAVDETFRRAGDLVARFGHCRFAVILPAADSKVAARFGERLLRNVHDLCIPHDRNEAADRVTVSVGIATMMPNKLHESRELVASSQIALGRAWEAGHNCAESTFLS